MDLARYALRAPQVRNGPDALRSVNGHVRVSTTTHPHAAGARCPDRRFAEPKNGPPRRRPGRIPRYLGCAGLHRVVRRPSPRGATRASGSKRRRVPLQCPRCSAPSSGGAPPESRCRRSSSPAVPWPHPGSRRDRRGRPDRVSDASKRSIASSPGLPPSSCSTQTAQRASLREAVPQRRRDRARCPAGRTRFRGRTREFLRRSPAASPAAARPEPTTFVPKIQKEKRMSGPSGDRLIIYVDMSNQTVELTGLPRSVEAAREAAPCLPRSCSTSAMPGCDALGPDNMLVMAPGVLAGTAAPTSGRISVGGKSPLTGGIKEANAGGQPGTGPDEARLPRHRREGSARGSPTSATRWTSPPTASPSRRSPTCTRASWNYTRCIDLLAKSYTATASFISIGPAGELRLAGASVC